MTAEKLSKLPKRKVENLKTSLKEVLALLEEHGASILPHMSDSDQNPGSRLREAMSECHIYEK